MLIPPWVYAAAGGTLLITGALGGWTVRDWKADSDQLAAIAKAEKVEKQLRDQLQQQAQAYEQERADAQPQSIVRQSEIRTIYRDRPVPADCAAPDDVGRVLAGAVNAANARASGKPAPDMPKPSRTPGPPDRP